MPALAVGLKGGMEGVRVEGAFDRNKTSRGEFLLALSGKMRKDQVGALVPLVLFDCRSLAVNLIIGQLGQESIRSRFVRVTNSISLNGASLRPRQREARSMNA